MKQELFRMMEEMLEEPAKEPFDFTEAMHALMTDIASVCDELSHVDMSRVVAIFSQARTSTLHGVRAMIYPLRFAGGARRARVRGHEFEMPRVMAGDKEALYVVSFTVPRFLNLPFEDKMAGTVHEMYHISPSFGGDLRRFAGGKPYHTGSQRNYNAAMARIAERYLAATQRPELHAFLRHNFAELNQAHGPVVGTRMRAPNPRRIG